MSFLGNTWLKFKYNKSYSYYIDGSFISPQESSQGFGNWIAKNATSKIYNLENKIEILVRLLGLQNILQTKIIVVYTLLHVSTCN